MSAIPEPDDDMSGDERPGATATIGMFIEYLGRRPNGVVLSRVTADPSRPALARDAHRRLRRAVTPRGSPGVQSQTLNTVAGTGFEPV